jgi:hypothetical protein
MGRAGWRTQLGINLLLLFPVVVVPILVLVNVDSSPFPLRAGTLRPFGLRNFGRDG